MKRKGWIKILGAFLVAGGLATGILSYAWRGVNLYAATPALPSRNASPCKVLIRPGQGMAQVSQLLSTVSIIRHPLTFRVLARVKGFDKKIKAGEYLLSAAMSPLEILGKMVRGDVVRYRVTIPEGYTMAQIAALVAESGLVPRDRFLPALSDTAFLARERIAAETFEGYLFPDTYFFPRGITPGEIISTMVARFRAVMTPERIARAGELGLSVHEVVTLAAVIEKETGAAAERPLISSVFHNRLKRGMRLESDPTVIYGIRDFNGNITKRDLLEETPYNTYRIKGLPRGPIASPGEAAIEAALHPADTEYLFFVARKDRTHQFSTNLEDHNRAVVKYQLN